MTTTSATLPPEQVRIAIIVLRKVGPSAWKHGEKLGDGFEKSGSRRSEITVAASGNRPIYKGSIGSNARIWNV